jgi:hypothetical protein
VTSQGGRGGGGGTLPRIQRISCRLSLRVKQVGHEGDHSPTTNDKLGMNGVTPLIPHMFSWCAAQLSTGVTLA